MRAVSGCKQSAQIVSMDCTQPWLTMRNRSYEFLSGVEVEVEVVTPRWTSPPHSLIVTFYCCPSQHV